MFHGDRVRVELRFARPWSGCWQHSLDGRFFVSLYFASGLVGTYEDAIPTQRCTHDIPSTCQKEKQTNGPRRKPLGGAEAKEPNQESQDILIFRLLVRVISIDEQLLG